MSFRNANSTKDSLPYDLVSCVLYKVQCGRYNASHHSETDHHLKVRSGEHIGFFLNCYLAVPQTNLGHFMGAASLTWC